MEQGRGSDVLPSVLRDLMHGNVLPVQFHEPAANTPERRLVLAVLMDAVQTYWGKMGSSKRKARRLFEEADEYLFSDDKHWPFSFLNICDILEIDAYSVRSVLEAERRAHRSRLARRRHLPHDASRLPYKIQPAGPRKRPCT